MEFGLKKINFPKSFEYRVGTDNEPINFFLDVLPQAKTFDLLLGYFSTSAISTLSLGFATFIYNGGRMRLIINQFLSEKDKQTIIEGQNGDSKRFYENELILKNIGRLKDELDAYGIHFFRCISYLISLNRIEIIAIKPKDKQGISHYKSGIFSDGQNEIKFKSSCNFTSYGLLENLEELEVKRSWGFENENSSIDEYKAYFELIFAQKADFVEYLKIEEVKTVIKDNYHNKEINELLVEEEKLIKEKLNQFSKPVVKKKLNELEKIVNTITNTPRFPFEEGPREYQRMAFENWRNNKQQGLFAMATGTGKTITSLNCLLEIFKKTGYYKALILVPTITLVNQWEEECRRFNFTSIVKISSKNNWKDDFAALLTRERLFPTEQVSYIVISTYASFSRMNSFSEMNKLSAKTLLIADECHNMGSSSLLKLLPKVNCKRRIGLSATPERQFDEEGNKKLFSFFNNENSYTYEYSMAEAINNNVLCRYYYYPHLVSLTDSEMNKYLELSLKIAKYFNPQKGSFDKSDQILTNLLLARKRIIHKAYNKVSAFSDILNEHYSKKKNLKYTLVYVPEGNDPNDYFETDKQSEKDEMEDDTDAVHLIDVFTEAVKQVDNRTTVKKFISGISSRDNILEQFANGEIDVLTSMKCLDEGVDVPRAELAIFCASTGNPRQFVQRRGRILRKHKEKQFAVIHDLVVIPEVNSGSDSYNMERNLLKKELERVNNFASLSENSSHTVNVLLDIMNYYNLNLYNNE